MVVFTSSKIERTQTVARRHIRTFSLDALLSETIDDLEKEGARSTLVLYLLQQITPQIQLDKFGLTQQDYEELVELYPTVVAVKDQFIGKFDPKKPNPGHFYVMHLNRYTNNAGPLAAQVTKEMNRRIRVHKLSKTPLINISRIVDALISLGLKTAREAMALEKARVAEAGTKDLNTKDQAASATPPTTKDQATPSINSATKSATISERKQSEGVERSSRPDDRKGHDKLSLVERGEAASV